MKENEIRPYWTKLAKSQFVGRKIVGARFMTVKEADEMGWNAQPVVLELDDGNLIYPSMDDEGNDGGALFCEKGSIMPVLRGQ